MLMYFDLVRLIKPNGSGRVRHSIHQVIMDFLDPRVEMAAIKPNVAFRQNERMESSGPHSRLDLHPLR